MRARRWAVLAAMVGLLGCDDDAPAANVDADAAVVEDASLQLDGGADAATCTPSPERCNGLDDDCDGEIDNGFGLGRACTVGSGPCENTGVFVCADDGGAAVCGAEPHPSTPEACDGADNDCDGAIDEDLALDEDPLNCGACGVVCAFANAEATCVAASCQFVDCADGFGDANANLDDGCECVIAGDERCNGLDDDCDGTVDEGLGVGVPCSVGVGACATSGVTVCGDDGVVCGAEPGAPAAEACNGLDDDCDGVVDNGFDDDGDGAPACDPTLCEGPCPDGFDCAVLCAAQDCAPDDPAIHPAAAEVCGDELDQNCDGRDAVCGQAHSVVTALAVASADAPGCRDFDGDGVIDNTFAPLALLTNGQLAEAIRTGQLSLLPTAAGLPVGAEDGRFDLSILRGTRRGLGPDAELVIAPDSYDENGVPIMRFQNAELVAGALRAGPGDFRLGLPLPGGAPGELRVTNALVVGDMRIEPDGLRIENGMVSGVVTEADLQVAVAVLDPALVRVLLNVLEADLDLDADGENDAYSACITYSALPIEIDAPED